MSVLRGRQSVCRRLFGPVDHDELQRDLELKLWEMTEQDSRRWNFNFQCETPLPGRFEWEEMSADCAAAFYVEPAQMKDAVSSPRSQDDRKLSSCEEGSGTDQENCSRISNTPKSPVRWKRSLSKPASEPGANALITDYFAKRRRTAETKNTQNPFHCSSSEAAQCRNRKMSMLLQRDYFTHHLY